METHVPRVLRVDHSGEGVVITFDDNRAAFFSAALLSETIALHKLPVVDDPPIVEEEPS